MGKLNDAIDAALAEIQILENENVVLRAELTNCYAARNNLRQELVMTGGLNYKANAKVRRSLDVRIRKAGKQLEKNNNRLLVLCRKYNIVR